MSRPVWKFALFFLFCIIFVRIPYILQAHLLHCCPFPFVSPIFCVFCVLYFASFKIVSIVPVLSTKMRYMRFQMKTITSPFVPSLFSDADLKAILRLPTTFFCSPPALDYVEDRLFTAYLFIFPLLPLPPLWTIPNTEYFPPGAPHLPMYTWGTKRRHGLG